MKECRELFVFCSAKLGFFYISRLLCFLFVFSVAFLSPCDVFAQHHGGQNRSRSNSSRTTNNHDSIEGIPAQKSASGVLLTPQGNCRTLKVYFPGHAQELGYRGSVPNKKEEAWIKYLLGPGNYNLAPAIKASGCPVLMLGDSTRYPNSSELEQAMELSGAKNIEIMSHSGGYDGLDSALSVWSAKLLAKVSTVSLIDNFYRPSLASKLQKTFSTKKLKEICRGFVTGSRSTQIYKNSFASICPNVETSESRKKENKPPLTHKGSVKEFF